MCIGCVSMCHREGGLYICLPSESNGPNLLDEPLKGFIVTPISDLVREISLFQVEVTAQSGIWESGLNKSCRNFVSFPTI